MEKKTKRAMKFDCEKEIIKNTCFLSLESLKSYLIISKNFKLLFSDDEMDSKRLCLE